MSVYSLRARPHPTVSTPLEWDELTAAVNANTPADVTFEAGQVVKRIERTGDLFAPVLEITQKLPSADVLHA